MPKAIREVVREALGNPRPAQDGLKTAQEAPRTAQEAPKTPQEPFRRAPKKEQVARSLEKHVEQITILCRSSVNDGPKDLRDRPKTVQEAPKKVS
eukprot:196095-Pyramimonas_sp.AAC.1